MKKYFWILLLGFALTGCGSYEKPDEYTITLDQIIAKYIKEVIRNDDFVLLGSGGGMKGSDIQHVSLHFKTYKNLELSELRRLVVEKEEQFLTMLNENEKIRFYMHDRPADSRVFEFKLILGNLGGGFVRPPYFATTSVLNGKIIYNQYDLEKDSLETVYIESYEDAYKIVYGHEKVLEEASSKDFELDEVKN